MPPEVDFKAVETKLDNLTKKFDSLPKAMTEDEAKKAIADISAEVKQLKDSGSLSAESLKELQEKSAKDLLDAFTALEKNVEQKWVTPPKMPHDASSIEQAKRIGNIKDLGKPDNFKQALICTDAGKAAAFVGMSEKQFLLKELQEASDDLMIIGAYLGMVDGTKGGPAFWNRDPSHLKTFQRYNALVTEFQKALDTGTSGEGADWLPTQMSATLVADMEIERGLGRRMPRFAQPTKSYPWPLKTGGATAYIVA